MNLSWRVDNMPGYGFASPPDGAVRVTVECSSNEPVEIDKLYGPMVFCNVRVTARNDTCEWVVEREVVPLNGESTWEEMARFGGQDSIEFSE